MTKLSIIVAYAHNRVIGLQDTIPWRIRNDLVHLKSLTKDQVVILGRKTYDSMAAYYDKSGRVMPAKKYIIVTRDGTYSPSRSNATTANSIEQAIKTNGAVKDLYVIGGMQIYKLALPFVHTIYATEIDAEIDGDAFFPPIDSQLFQEVSRELHKKDESNEYNYSFVIYRRK